MADLHIKDIESLDKLDNEIVELKKKIEELQEVKELKKSQQKEVELKNKIIKYSTYDLMEIGNIIAKLMTIFGGKQYYCARNNLLWAYDYCIEPISYNVGDMSIYAFYKFKKLKHERIPFDTSEKKDKCYLPPSSFHSNNSSTTNSKYGDTEYVQVFLDYLYQRRSSKLLEEINEKDLEKILQEFLEISIELQKHRKDEIERKIEEKIQYQKRREFEKSCVIDRKLILSSLAYIINHYEEDMSAKLEKKEEWSRSSQWSELTGYQILTINYNNKEIYFKAKIDSEGCYPDEEYCGVYVDMNKHSDICFFEIKSELSSALKSSNYLLEFMNSIEKMYLEKQNITVEDIQQLLVNISNDNKYKQRTLSLCKKGKTIL